MRERCQFGKTWPFVDITDSWKLVGWGKMGFKAQTCWTDLLAFWGVWNRSRILNFGPDRLFFRFPEPWYIYYIYIYMQNSTHDFLIPWGRRERVYVVYFHFQHRFLTCLKYHLPSRFTSVSELPTLPFGVLHQEALQWLGILDLGSSVVGWGGGCSSAACYHPLCPLGS